jgi:hypothetical protein
MKEWIVFYCGEDLLWEGETRHVPDEGDWVKLPQGVFVAAKIHHSYSPATDFHECCVMLAPLSKPWLQKLVNDE